jgi:hypothetical protein
MKQILAITAILCFCACHKALELDDLEFDVTAAKATPAIGDTVNFSFRGNPDLITFWSGEPGRRYRFRDRTEADGTPILRFRSKRFHAQNNTLSLLISTDFAGVVKDTAATRASIGTANWTDITAQANLSPANGTLTSSGPVSLASFASQGKPVYFAFRYKGAAGYPLNRWEIDSFYINNNLPDGTTYVIGNFNSYNVSYTNYGVPTFNPGFVFYNLSNTNFWFNSTVNSQAGLVFKTDNAGLTADADSWAIVGPINLKKVTPDNGVVIKSLAQNLRDLRFSYRYMTAGNYEATFVAGKTNRNEDAYSIKPLTFTVQ